MRDTLGTRFQRMAGSDQFFSALNKGLERPPVNQNSSSSVNYGDYDSGQNENSPTPGSGPGSFGKQVERETNLRKAGFNDGGGSFESAQDMKAAAGVFKRDPAQQDGSGVANKYINSAKNNQTVNIEALDKNIRSAPLYQEAKSELRDLNLYGDRYRWSREELPEFKLPTPMEGVERPDFGGMGEGFMDKISDLKVKA